MPQNWRRIDLRHNGILEREHKCKFKIDKPKFMAFILDNYRSAIEYLDLIGTSICFVPEVVLELFNCPKLLYLAFDNSSSIKFETSPLFLSSLSVEKEDDEVPNPSPIRHRKKISRNLLDPSATHSFAIKHLVWPPTFGTKLLTFILKSTPNLTTVPIFF